MLDFELLAPDLYLLKTPFAALWSGVFLLRGEESILIDSGAGADTVDNVIVPALERLGVPLSSIKWIVNTHAHGDHAFGNFRLIERTGAKLAAFDEAVDKFVNPLVYSIKTRAKYPEYSPKPPASLPSLTPDLVLHDGDTLMDRIKIFATPGHDTECISILDLKTNSLMTGDSLQFGGTRSSAGSDIAFYKDLPGYRETIAKIRAIAPENLFSSHDYQPSGCAFFGREEVERCLDICEQVADTYSKWVGDLLDAGIEDVAEIARTLIRKTGGVEPTFIFTDMYTADEHVGEVKRLRGE